MEFFAEVDGEKLHGVDIVTINARGKILSFDILARPQSIVQKLGGAVKAQLNQTEDLA